MGLHENRIAASAGRSVIAASLSLSLGAAACARTPPVSSGWVRDGCSVQASSHHLPVGAVPRTAAIRIGLPETVRFRPTDTLPGKDNRVVLQHVYETLVAIDCAGRPVPGLAAEWTMDERGRRWEFAMRAGSSFSDGSPVDAAAIRASWQRTRVAGVAVESVVGDGAGRIIVNLAAPGVREPRAFSDGHLLVRRTSSGARWPLGTGPYRVAENPDDRTLALVATGPAASELIFESMTGSRARNLLDLGWEAVLTRDRRVAQYAGKIPRLAAIELPWDRTYVLAVPSASGAGIDPVPSDLLDVLARDAVRAQARPFPGRMHLGERSEALCSATGPPTAVVFAEDFGPPQPPSPRESIRRVTHDQSDATATNLAARLVALSGGSAAGGEDVSARFLNKALGLDNQAELAASLRTLSMPSDSLRRLFEPGSPPKLAHAYVVALPTALPGCVSMPGYRLFPLIMTRPTLIMDRRLKRVDMGPGGLPLFTDSTIPGP